MPVPPTARTHDPAGRTRHVAVDGARLCVATLGDLDDPALLLLNGATDSMDWWEDELCDRLAAAGRLVIRYDQRETGQSTGGPGYGFDDLVADAIAVLDDVPVRRAHVVGASLGGAVAQRLAVEHRERVASLTLLSTSPGLRPNAAPDPDLPLMAPELLAAFTDPEPEPEPEPDWSDRHDVVEHLVAGRRRVAGSRGFDTDHLRRLVSRMVDRSVDLKAGLSGYGRLAPGRAYRADLATIAVPTLVIHGTEDPLFPFGHAEALAREIPGAELVPLDGVGHQMPPPWAWDAVVAALLRHTGPRP